VRIVTMEGETIYANSAILGIYGYDSIEELNTTPIQNRYARESYAEFRIRREKRQQGVDVPSEYTIDIIRKNGDVRHLRVFRKDILWDDKKQYQVIYQDITEHRQAEEKLAVESRQLEETNEALRVLLRHREEDRREMEQKIVATVQKLVLPYVAELRKLRLNPRQSSYLDIIDSNLQQVINPFLQNLTAHVSVLTPREIQVSNLIREGKTSKET
jgi:PAS domain S-box-containing protein